MPPLCADSQLMVLPTSFTSSFSRDVNTLLQCRPSCSQVSTSRTAATRVGTQSIAEIYNLHTYGLVLQKEEYTVYKELEAIAKNKQAISWNFGAPLNT